MHVRRVYWRNDPIISIVGILVLQMLKPILLASDRNH
jgi:hypothetical protein